MLVFSSQQEPTVGLGTWPDWVAAVGTSLALLIAAITYLRDSKRRRETQAVLVYSYIADVHEYDPPSRIKLRTPSLDTGIGVVHGLGPNNVDLEIGVRAIEVTVSVHNGSSELIGPIKAQLVNSGEMMQFGAFHRVSVPPQSEESFTFYFENPVPGGSPSLGSSVVFRDARGRWWRRHLAEPVRRIHDDPENSAPTAGELQSANANLAAMGLPPNPPLKLSLKARLWRTWRTVRRLPPVG